MTVTAEASSEPEVIPRAELVRHLERAISAHLPYDHRAPLLKLLKAGPDAPLDPRAQEFSRSDAVLLARQVLRSIPRDETCTLDRSQAALCDPPCAACRTLDAERAALTDLISGELDALEAELSGLAEAEPVSPDPGKWYAHCQDCGQRFLTSSKLARYCTEACRKRSSRAAQAREQAARVSQEQS